MERTLSIDEKIKKAEEIYQRKNQKKYGTYQARMNVTNIKKDYKLFKKMITQIVICSLIYLFFYSIKNSNYIFSKDFLSKTKDVLSYDINVVETYKNISNWINKMDNEKKENDETNQIVEETQEYKDVEKVEDEANLVEEKQTEENNQMTLIDNISSKKEEEIQTLSIAEDSSSISETLTDADIIKLNYSIIKPLIGTITSRFGNRNPTTPTVPKYHTGIDIAANTGTVFIAAMSGTVVQVSSEGDYGNHIKIMQDDVATLYAHCSKIYVNEGDIIEQGEEIGEVGSTGNATGPHLHFEIRKSERFVNPDDIIEF